MEEDKEDTVLLEGNEDIPKEDKVVAVVELE